MPGFIHAKGRIGIVSNPDLDLRAVAQTMSVMKSITCVDGGDPVMTDY